MRTFDFPKDGSSDLRKDIKLAVEPLPTNKAQQLPQHYIESIQRFYIYIRNFRKVSLILYRLPTLGTPILSVFRLCDIANVDQTPCSFELLDGKTYNIQGEKTVWVKPMVVFREKKACKSLLRNRDCGTVVFMLSFKIMHGLMRISFYDGLSMRGSYLGCQSLINLRSCLYLLDVHQAQKTELVN